MFRAACCGDFCESRGEGKRFVNRRREYGLHLTFLARAAKKLRALAAKDMKKNSPKYKRILLKLSGEALGGEAGVSISAAAVQSMAEQIREVRELACRW